MTLFVRDWVSLQKQRKVLLVLQVIERMLHIQQKASFMKRSLLVREGVESNPGPQTIRETLDWYRDTLKNGKCSEAKIKEEALIFFNLSSANQMKDKKIFKKALENLVKANTNTQNNILREVLKIHNGKGAFNDLPPDDFSTQISDEKKRKALFVQQCIEEIKIGSKYLSWIYKDFELFIDSKKVTSSKIKGRVGETLLTRERSSRHMQI